MSDDPAKQQLNPSALAVPDAARLLSKVGGRPLDPELLALDIADGAPTNPDGTLNLVHYAAWLVKELARQHGH